MTLHRRSGPCGGLVVTISARYDWSVARKSTSFPPHHWNLRKLTLPYMSLDHSRFFSARTILSHGSIMLPPVNFRKGRPRQQFELQKSHSQKQWHPLDYKRDGVNLILLKCLWNEKLRYWKIGLFERPLKVKKNGVFLFVISHIVPEIFKIFVLCKLGTDDVIRCDSMEVKTQNREYLCK